MNSIAKKGTRAALTPYNCLIELWVTPVPNPLKAFLHKSFLFLTKEKVQDIVTTHF